jgi:hypothetical protein
MAYTLAAAIIATDRYRTIKKPDTTLLTALRVPEDGLTVNGILPGLKERSRTRYHRTRKEARHNYYFLK